MVSEADPADLVLVDYLMPGMTGAEVIQIIKRLQPDVPVVAISGVLQIDLDQEAADWGADGALAKPIDLGQMLALIHTLLNMPCCLRHRLEAICPPILILFRLVPHLPRAQGSPVGLASRPGAVESIY